VSVGLRVVIDGDRCLGNARCVAAAPMVFDVDDDGNSMLIIDGDIPDEHAAKVDLAIRSCPTGAISLGSDQA
jgi:ferredoxin